MAVLLQVFISWKTDTLTLVNLTNGILFTHKKEQTHDTSRNTDESLKHAV